MQTIFLAINWSNLYEGLIISVFGYVVVFIALAAIYYTFRYLPVILNLSIRRRLRMQGKPVPSKDEMQLPSDVSAAIAMALYLYTAEIHDNEHTVLTIRKVSKTYSPWSSKIYGLRHPLPH